MGGSPRTTGIGVSGGAATTAYTGEFTVTSGSTAREVIGTVKEGQRFIARSVSFTTVQDPGGDFTVALYSGAHRVSPENGAATMSVDELLLPAVEVFDVGDDITVRFDATSRTNDVDVSVHVSGIEPEKLELLSVETA